MPHIKFTDSTLKVLTVDKTTWFEAFNGRFHAECLNAHWFMGLEDTVEKLEVWPLSTMYASPAGQRQRLQRRKTAQRHREQSPGSTDEIARRTQPACVIKVRKTRP